MGPGRPLLCNRGWEMNVLRKRNSMHMNNTGDQNRCKKNHKLLNLKITSSRKAEI